MNANRLDSVLNAEEGTRPADSSPRIGEQLWLAARSGRYVTVATTVHITMPSYDIPRSMVEYVVQNARPHELQGMLLEFDGAVREAWNSMDTAPIENLVSRWEMAMPRERRKSAHTGASRRLRKLWAKKRRDVAHLHTAEIDEIERKLDEAFSAPRSTPDEVRFMYEDEPYSDAEEE